MLFFVFLCFVAFFYFLGRLLPFFAFWMVFLCWAVLVFTSLRVHVTRHKILGGVSIRGESEGVRMRSES